MQSKAAGKIFYGWVIAAAAALGVATSISVFIPSTIGLMVGPLSKDLGWSPPQIYLAVSFSTFATIFVAPFIGRFIDRFGARRVIALSFVAEALITFSFRHLDDNISLFYMRYTAFSVFATGTTAVAFSALISRWFDRNRGVALGIALAGLGVGGVFWSLATQRLFETVGWRDAFAWLAAVIAFIVLPLLLLTLRDSPASVNLTVDGDPVPASTQKREIEGWTLRQAIGSGRYWLMLIAFFLMASAIYGITLNLVPLFQSQGQSAAIAAAAQASMWAVLVVGRISTGWLMDRFFAPLVALGFLVPAIIGISALAMGVDGPMAFAAAMMVGLASGAEVDVLAYLTGRYFGLKHFGSIYATYFSVYAMGTSVGSYVAAFIADRAKNYSPALWVLAGALCMAGILLTRFPRFQLPITARNAAPNGRLSVADR